MCSPNLGPGWNISPQGWNLISENNTLTDKNILLKNALNADLKEIGLPVLTKELSKSQIFQLVLQIQKIRNVSAPKINEDSQAAPRMLKLILTDGESYAQAIETSSISTISRERTPPGSKLFLNNVKILNGFLILNGENTKLLGGKVPHLCEKWELAKSVQHCSRPTVAADGPPSWVNFGCKIMASGDELRSSDNKIKDPSKENLEFESLRQGAIAEATTGAVKKVFGGGIKQPVQNNYRNDGNRGRIDGNRGFNKGKKELNRGGKDKEVEDRPQKPSDKVSLFDFLEDKLNITETSTSAKQKNDGFSQSYTSKPSFENKKYNYNTYEKGISNNKNNYQKKEYNNYYNERKYNSRENQTNKPFGVNGIELDKNQDHFTSSSYDIPREPSFNKDPMVNKRPNFNPAKYNNPRGFLSHNEVTADKREHNKNEELYNVNKHFNKGLTKAVKDTNLNQENDFHDKHESSQINSNRNSTNRSSRNEREKMIDSWHYRAPDKPNNMSQITTNHIDNLTEGMGKVSVNSEFASRSLRQHLNLDTRRAAVSQNQNSLPNNENADTKGWNVGDECLAKYWEDEKFYPAKITALTESTYVVQFKGYGNIEEVLKNDCMPFRGHEKTDEKRHYKGTLEFRRNPRKFTSS